MAKEMQNSTQIVNRSFTKGLNKDADPSFVQEGMWTHARNVVNNTEEGNLGTLSNEDANALCITAGATMPGNVLKKYIIGAIQLFSDKWVIYTAGHNVKGISVSSEIGLFEADTCTYRPIVQDACLNFDKRYLISGSSREKEDCTWQVYWADGNNPDRFLNIGDPQTWPKPPLVWAGQANINYYVDGTSQVLWPGVAWAEKEKQPTDPCRFIDYFQFIDCDKIRLARLMETPCLKVTLGNQGGTLRNGTYFATIAYSIKGQRVTDYFSPSNTQPIWFPNDLQGSLIIDVEADQANFDEFQLVLVQNINQGTVAKQIGTYSTKTTRISIDQIKVDLVSVPLQFLPLQTPVFEKSDQIVEVNNYLLRVGPTSKFDFNYQPLANLIQTKWASVEYPADYYVKGGNKGSYLRDEVYAFFIRWVYDTGDKSASYHIPGRAPIKFPTSSSPTFENDDDNGTNSLTADDKIFEVYNTASVNLSGGPIGTTTDDGGTIIGYGNMGYWESTEEYPDDRPDIYNASYHCWTGVFGKKNLAYDLCGTPIRHHKFPDNMSDPGSAIDSSVTNHFRTNLPYSNNPLQIRLMGVYFENITYPKDNEGNDIPGIVGYEILRGSREGNRSIIAKGMLNNFRSYQLRGQVVNNASPTTGLYANYPFNTINGFYNTGSGSDHNRPFMDPYIRINDPDITNPKYNDNVEDQFVPRDIVSFHSPDTMFNTPYLSATELKLYGYLRGTSRQKYIEPNKHPQFKLMSDLCLFPMFLSGIIDAITSMRGQISINSESYGSPGYTSVPPTPDPAYALQLTGAGIAQQAYTQFPYVFPAPIIPPIPFAVGYNGALQSYFTSGASLVDALSLAYTGTTPNLTTIDQTLAGFMAYPLSVGGVSVSGKSYSYTLPDWAYLDPVSRALGATNQLLFYFSEGARAAQALIKAIIPYDQFALQMIAHGFYDDMRSNNSANGLYRFKIDDSTYIRGNIQQLPSYYDYSNAPRTYSINNLNRSDSVVIRTSGGPNYTPPPFVKTVGPNYITEATGVQYVDQSLTTLGHIQQNGLVYSDTLNSYIPSGNEAPNFENLDNEFSSPIASHYAGMKVRIRNQYGQLQSIKQIAITPCEQKFKYEDLGDSTNGDTQCNACNVDKKLKEILRTPVFFGGDTFVNRYTEKNTMFFFYDWLFGQPDGFEYNYLLHQMVPQPRFWANSKDYDVSELAPTNWFSLPAPGTGPLPSRFYRLDYKNYDYVNEPNQINYPGIFRPKESNFYLACSSVRDFFVESDVLVDFRIAGDYEWEKHYNPYNYTDLFRMFDMDPQNITRGNWYRYDYSLSISKLFNQYFSSGALQNTYYDPKVAKLCYTYLPDRIYYSLQQQDESFKDSWFIFLPNNYREFKSQISGVKSINKSGIFITFKNDSPQMFQGVDTLNTDLGTKITIGDGGLFSQPGQAVTNADKPYEYGSSQNRLSVISTPAGLFFVSQNQGKIFSYGEGLKEISQIGLKWWFALFLKYKLTQHFPEYAWQDNPVAGIGIQAVYDNENSILYFCKKDYDLRPELEGRVNYVPLVKECYIDSNGLSVEKGTGDYFTLDGLGRYMIGDPRLFLSASWTISYDPKNEFWISYHDWHPDLVIPAKTVFYTTKENTVWRHNFNCQQYCNYYGVNYPFEIEFPIITGQTTTIIKSFEYLLECYTKADNCVDQFHVLDYNFDNALVYNSEQVSGYLNLNIFPKNNVTLSLDYPKFNQNIPMIFTNPVNGQAQFINTPGFDILFSKEENKYRFNQFWDITKDRGEFPIGAGYPPSGTIIPGTTELFGTYTQQVIWNTNPDGYTRNLNFNNLDFTKPLLQRKKFRHYTNYLALRKEVSGNVNMILKLVDSKNQYSPR